MDIQCALFIWYDGYIPFSFVMEPMMSGSHFTFRISSILSPSSPSLDSKTLIKSPNHFLLFVCLNTTLSGYFGHGLSPITPYVSKIYLFNLSFVILITPLLCYYFACPVDYAAKFVHICISYIGKLLSRLLAPPSASAIH